jgi:hypothetical protein
MLLDDLAMQAAKARWVLGGGADEAGRPHAVPSSRTGSAKPVTPCNTTGRPARFHESRAKKKESSENQ